MPYIKKDLRPVFYSAVVLVQKGQIGEAMERILLGVKDMEPKSADGCLNYVFTQLLRKVEDVVEAKIVIDLTLNALFWSHPKYFRFERVNGLLGCMIDEYQRRGWKRQTKVVRALKDLLRMNKHYTASYEDLKILENGDLE